MGRVTNGKFSEYTPESNSKTYRYMISAWNISGYIPCVRTITGSIRALLGTIDIIAGIALSIFSSTQNSLQISFTGLLNVGRGVIEVGSDALFLLAIAKESHEIFKLFLLSGIPLAAYDYLSSDPKDHVVYS